MTSNSMMQNGDPSAASQTPPKRTETDIILLFLDIAGFSKMSADLVANDSRGAEEIMRVLSRSFHPIIEIIALNGGVVAATAGDALIAFWRPDQDLRTAAEAAHKAAHQILSLPDVTYAGNQSISIKLLLDFGKLNILEIGGHDGKFASVFSGDLFAKLQGNSQRMLPYQIITTDAFDHARNSQHTSDSSGSEPIMFRDGLGYINSPQNLDDKPNTAPNFPSEFRSIALLFIKLSADHLNNLATAQSIALTLQKLITSQEGALLHYQSDDKGIVGLGAWGIPKTAHENKSARAVFAATEIVVALRKLGVDAQIGVTTGDALAGEISNTFFRQYTVLSDVVNTAAVLATHARPGQILCDLKVKQAAQFRFTFEEAKQLVPKGQTDVIVAFQPLDELNTDASFGQALIGRQSELEIFQSTFAQASKHHKPLVRIVAPAGLGKSHLGAVLSDWLGENGFRCLHGAADALRKATAYHPWRPVFASLTETLNLDNVKDILGDNAVHLSLLNPVLNLAEDEAEVSKSLSPAARSQLTNDLIIQLLQSLIGTMPTVIVFEDTHWLDSTSWGLIAQCRRQLEGVGMLLLTRPVAREDQPMAALALLQNNDVTTLELLPFDRAGSDALVASQLGTKDIAPTLGARIFDLASGHPLYTKELTKLILERGIIHVSNGYCHISTQQLGFEHEGFPKDLGATLTERIDALGDAAKRLLKVAAVQGRNVEIDILKRTLGHDAQGFDMLLNEVSELGLLEQTDDIRWRFHHALIAEAAYELLLRDEQQGLHRGVAEAMEAEDTATNPARVGLLAYHWEAGNQPQNALPYLDKALITARSQHANQEVLRYGTRALELSADHASLVTHDQVGFWHNAMQQAYRSQGHFTGTDDHLRSIMTLFDRPPPASAGSYLFQTITEFLRLKFGRKISGRSRDAQLRAAAAHLTSAEVAYDRQDTLRLLHGTIRGANLAFSAGGTAVEIAIANSQMAMTAIFLPFAFNGDTYAARAEAMLSELEDEGAKSWILVVLSAYEFCSGRFEKSCRLSEDAMASAILSREVKNWEYAASGKANVLRLQAKFAECEALDDQVYESGHDRDVPQVKLWGTVGQLKNLWITNQFELFEQWLERSSSLLSDDLNKLNSAASNTIGHHTFYALHHLRHGRHDAAVAELMETKRLFEGLRDPQTYMVDPLSYIMDAVRGLRHAGGHNEEVLILTDFVLKSTKNTHRLYSMCWARRHLAQGDWHEARGDMPKAVKAWTKATDTSGPVDIPFDNAMAHYRLAKFGGLSAEDSAVHDRAVREILARLSVALPVSWTL